MNLERMIMLCEKALKTAFRFLGQNFIVLLVQLIDHESSHTQNHSNYRLAKSRTVIERLNCQLTSLTYDVRDVGLTIRQLLDISQDTT